MSDCPAPLRGFFYNTHLTLRCFSYKGCATCGMCENFDRHSLHCQTCEGRKKDATVNNGCTCTPGQKELYRDMQEKFRRPMFSLDGIAMPGLNENIAQDHAELGERIRKEFSGVGVNTAVHTVEDTGTVGEALGVR